MEGQRSELFSDERGEQRRIEELEEKQENLINAL